MSIWGDALKAIQLKPRYLFGLWLLGLLLLTLPSRFATSFGVVELRDHYRSWIGLVTLGAFSFWLVQLVPVVRQRWTSRKWKQHVMDSLAGLTPQERFLLAFCVQRRQRTVYLKITDPRGTSLCDKGLMERAAGEGSILSWPCTIPTFVWKLILANRYLILSEGEWSNPKLQEAFGEFEDDTRSRLW